MIEIRPSTKSDITPIASDMREIDQIECMTWSGLTPRQSLLSSMIFSDECYTIDINGIPSAIFGWGADSGIDDNACVWFLATNRVNKYTREFLTYPKPYFERMFEKYSEVYNYVCTDNKKALRFLKYHGFTFGDMVKKENRNFVKVTRERVNV